MDHVVPVRSHRAVASLVAVLAVVTLLAAACGGSSSSGTTSGTNPKAAKNGTNITVPDPGQPKSGGTLTFGLNAETNGWSPVLDEWAGSAYIVAGAIFDHLAEYNTKDQPTPYLAQSITPNADFTVWTIKMRSGVLFQDGEKCDASAVAANFNAQRASALTGPVFQTVTDVKVVDDLTVQLTMNQPWSTFPNTLTTQPGAMAAPQAMLNQKDGGATHPVGTGPFTFSTWTPNSSLVVKKNPNYWRKGFPYLDGITFQIQTDAATRTGALETGEDGVIEQQDPGQIKALASQAEAGKLQFFTDSGLYQTESFQALNTAVAPFNDPLARQIVAYATDRVNLVKAPFQGVFTPATGPFGPGEPYYVPNTGNPAFDLTKAKQLEAQYEAKNGHPLSFTMLITPQSTVVATGQFLQQAMKQAGVNMTLKPEDQVTLIQDVILGNYQSTAFLQFGTVTLDTMFVFIVNTTIKPVGGLSLNYTRYDDPVLTQAMLNARKTGNLQQQIAQYKIAAAAAGQGPQLHLLGSQPAVDRLHQPGARAHGLQVAQR